MPVISEVEVVNEVNVASSAVLRDGLTESDDDLTVKVSSFYYDMGGVKGKFTGALAQPVTDNTTNYVFLDDLAALQINTTGWPGTTHIRLSRVVTSGGIITRIILERALLGSASSTGDHGSLTGLGDDDHPQYLLVDGTRSMTGNLDIGNNKIINLANPTVATDGATKSYVDTQIGAAWREDEFVAAASQVTFILSQAPSDLDSFTLYVNGVAYDDADDYTVSGTTLTWLNTLFIMDAGDKLLARYI